MSIGRSSMFVFVAALTLSFGVGYDKVVGEAGTGGPSISRSTSAAGADGSSGRIILSLPAVNEAESETSPVPPTEGNEPPAEPNNVPSEDDGEPITFFGEGVAKRSVFILDVSLSMNCTGAQTYEDYDGNVATGVSRLEMMQYETVKMLNEMDESNWVDFVLLAGGLAGDPLTDAWKKELTQLTPEVQEEAIQYIKTLTTWWGTPTLKALERATNDYPEIEQIVCLSDGNPFPMLVEGGVHKELCLQKFPEWYAPHKAKGCSMIVMQIGNHPLAQSFLVDLASQNDAKYIHVQ